MLTCLHTYMLTYLHTYILTSLHPYILTCIHAYMHTCIHAYMHTCIHAYRHTWIHAYMHTCIHAYMHTCMHACIHAYMHTCIHAYIHAHMHTYIHTYIDLYIYIYISLYIIIHNTHIRVQMCIYTRTHTHIYIYIFSFFHLQTDSTVRICDIHRQYAYVHWTHLANGNNQLPFLHSYLVQWCILIGDGSRLPTSRARRASRASRANRRMPRKGWCRSTRCTSWRGNRIIGHHFGHRASTSPGAGLWTTAPVAFYVPQRGVKNGNGMGPAGVWFGMMMWLGYKLRKGS